MGHPCDTALNPEQRTIMLPITSTARGTLSNSQMETGQEERGLARCCRESSKALNVEHGCAKNAVDNEYKSTADAQPATLGSGAMLCSNGGHQGALPRQRWLWGESSTQLANYARTTPALPAQPLTIECRIWRGTRALALRCARGRPCCWALEIQRRRGRAAGMRGHQSGRGLLSSV